MDLMFLALSLLIQPLPLNPKSSDILVDECGYVEDDSANDRLIFHGFETGSYLLDRGFIDVIADTIYVYSYADTTCGVEDLGLLGCLGYPIHGTCEIFDFGCRELGDWCSEDPGQCPCFYSPGHGYVRLFDLHGFAYGDSVRVAGRSLTQGWATYCVFDAIVRVETIVACSDTLSPTQSTSWGEIKAIFGRSDDRD